MAVREPKFFFTEICLKLKTYVLGAFQNYPTISFLNHRFQNSELRMFYLANKNSFEKYLDN